MAARTVALCGSDRDFLSMAGVKGLGFRTHLDTYVKPDETAWVFLWPKRDNFHGIWDKARKTAGIPDLHQHDLRRTGNTLAAATGATLRELIGHGSSRAALIYLHARGQEIADGIDQMVSRTTAKAGKKTKKPLKRSRTVLLGRSTRRRPGGTWWSG